MQRTDFRAMPCSIARTLAVVGEPWTPLILRDVLFGLTRFDELQRDLGVATNILTERSRRPLSKRAAAAVATSFATVAQDGRTTETFEILHFACWTPPA